MASASIPVQGVIFDCDGTLMDTMGLWASMEYELGARAGHAFSKEERDTLRACTIGEIGQFMHDRLGLMDSPQAVVEEIERLAQDFYATKSQLKPGAWEFLCALEAHGIPCAIASSSPHSLLDPGVEHTGIGRFLRAVVSTDDVGVSKREPAVYDKAREILGSDLEATWVFEDGAYTFAATVPAGYATVGVYDTQEAGTFEELSRLADVAIRDYRELDVERFLAGEYRRR